MRGWIVCVVFCSACSLGVGPNAGYGLKHGWFGGVEAAAGITVPEAVFGYQSSGNTVYGRLDIDIDPIDDPPPLGARFGAGYGTALSREHGEFFMFAGGPALTRSFKHYDTDAGDLCSNVFRGAHDVGFEISLQLRHTDEWQLALSSHFDCVRTSTTKTQ